MEEDHFTDVKNEASGTETPPAELASDGSLNEIGHSHSDQSAQLAAFQEEEQDLKTGRR